ncbi:hypothetical protein BDN71DRAFT_1506250 [Pleurotus eryngii]|uniref:Uncharacterized protein n=1 Tax=Pleurotus eryngii TaxID=5323 RepID=A0A9P5ZXP8_PLEER|nr:hypothetical protein BDN71DRAFT_1506250 [Pleurotus eryngii]
MPLLLNNLRNITLRSVDAVLKTLTMRLIQEAPISTARWADQNTYKKQPKVRQQALTDITEYSASCGADKAGAVTAEAAGGYHEGTGVDTWSRVTVKFWDENNNQMYFRRKSDDTYWDRLHIPERIEMNKKLWEIEDDYSRITLDEFESKRGRKGGKAPRK